MGTPPAAGATGGATERKHSTDPIPPTVLQAVKKLEAAARESALHDAAQHLNRAGDLCARAGAGAEESAKQLYGRAIDANLRAGDYAPAAAICRKLIRFDPDVVRARCTLAFLAFGNRFRGDATAELEGYVAAVRRTETERFAIPRLRLLANALPDPETKRLIAAKLRELGAPDVAEAVEGEAESAAGSAVERAGITAEEQWQNLMKGALLEPDSMWRDYWLT
ncbi:MAG TPA: hypothetical protein VMK65_07370 [Longimicrobiales bacterium]|nr:hypothetical protein [Longimicrobiales bacterium]